jgi:RNA polymerase sigma factor (sigma-70 family)
MAKQSPTRRRAESSDSTADLVLKARSGDRSAENEIVRRNLPELTQYARGRLPGAARAGNDTEDLVQDTMIQALKRLSTFDPSRRGGFQAYLRTSLRHRVCDEVRRAIRSPQISPIQDTPDHGPTPHDVIAARETAANYKRALATLRPTYRALVQAHIERDWTHEQIARMFGKPSVNAARVALGRAISRLLAAMAREPQPRPRRGLRRPLVAAR